MDTINALLFAIALGCILTAFGRTGGITFDWNREGQVTQWGQGKSSRHFISWEELEAKRRQLQ